MRIDEYLSEYSISVSDFADKIGARSRATVYRYMGGRVPKMKMMEKIHKATSGLVTAADFYPKPKHRPSVNGNADHVKV